MEWLMMFVLPLIGASAGSFLGAYLRKKAENVATKEDIQEVTRLAKTIEGKISIDVWSHQQRWDAQKAALLETLKELASAETMLFRMVHVFQKNMRDESWLDEIKNADQKHNESMDAFWRSKLAVQIVCGRTIGDQVEKIDHMFGLVRVRIRQRDFADIWDVQVPEIHAAKRELGVIIRQHLGFEAQSVAEFTLAAITPQSSGSSAGPAPAPPTPE